MLENLKIDARYDGFLYLAKSVYNPPLLNSHHHIELEINLVVNGEITYIVDNHRFTLGQGTLLWIFPQQEHQLVNRTNDAEYYVGVFKPSMIERACLSETYKGLKAQNIKGTGLLHTLLSPRKFRLIQALMNSLMEDALPHDILNREVGFGKGSSFRFQHGDPDELNAGLRHLLLLSWKTQLRGEARSNSLKLHPSVQKTLHLINDLTENHSLKSVARKSGVSDAYLSRTFHKQMGVSLSRYRNMMRLGRFWDYYHKPHRPSVKEAMSEAGFGSYPQFYKVFYEHYGKGSRALLSSSIV